MDPTLTREEYLRYSRNLLLPEIGLGGQQKLKGASVLIVGLGGLGSPTALYLGAAGVGRIGLADFDTVGLSNLQRQVIHGTSSLGINKAISGAKRLKDLNPDIQVDVIDKAIDASNAMQILAAYQVVIDASDNFAARYLLNDTCFFLNKILVHGSVHRFEGQVSVFDAHHGPCYRCVFPTPPPPEMTPTCEESGVLGTLPGMIGAIQAMEAIKLLLGMENTLRGTLLIHDALEMTFQKIQLRKNPGCLLCGDHPSIIKVEDGESIMRSALSTDHLQPGVKESFISAAELDLQLRKRLPITLLDVREPHELDISSLPGAINIPFSQLAGSLVRLDKSAEIVTFCRTGERSLRAMRLLRAAGFLGTRCLEGGINAWAAQIDPDLPQY